MLVDVLVCSTVLYILRLVLYSDEGSKVDYVSYSHCLKAGRGSQIADRNKVCDRLRSYGNQPLDRTWFYLLRSSAIAIADDRRSSFHMIADDRRPYCDLRSAIRDHMETSLK